MEFKLVYILPVIAAFIGWITNYIAVKMLFHPRKPVRLFFFTVQGVFPKRQSALAKKLGEIVSKELLSSEDIKRGFKESVVSPEILKKIDAHIEEIIIDKLPRAIPMLAMVMNPELVKTVKNVFLDNMKETFGSMAGFLGEKVTGNIDIHKIVEEKINNFSSEKLEELIFTIMKKEFQFIELVGAVLGFFIGTVQVLLISY